MRFFTDGVKSMLRQYEDQNLISLNNDRTFHYTGGAAIRTRFLRWDSILTEFGCAISGVLPKRRNLRRYPLKCMRNLSCNTNVRSWNRSV